MRQSQGYNPDFDIDLAHGLAGERQVGDVLLSTLEVKSDRQAARTGNVWLEYECRGRDGVWRDSGIRTSRAKHFAYVIGDVLILVVPMELMRRIVDRGIAERRLSEETDGSNPTKGVKLPIGLFLEWIRLDLSPPLIDASPTTPPVPGHCGNPDPWANGTRCVRSKGHDGPHESDQGLWPQAVA